MFYKVRTIGYQCKAAGGQPIKGITLPDHVACFFDEVYMTINRSGNSLILTSGTNNIPTKKEVEAYRFK